MKEKLDLIKDSSEIKEDLAENNKSYLDELRSEITELKEKNLDPHCKLINPQQLTDEDLMVFDKFKKGELQEGDFENYRRNLQLYFYSQKEALGEQFSSLKDSRSNFLAMLLNKVIDRNIQKNREGKK